jgi:hypothetical protein
MRVRVWNRPWPALALPAQWAAMGMWLRLLQRVAEQVLGEPQPGAQPVR